MAGAWMAAVGAGEVEPLVIAVATPPMMPPIVSTPTTTQTRRCRLDALGGEKATAWRAACCKGSMFVNRLGSFLDFRVSWRLAGRPPSSFATWGVIPDMPGAEQFAAMIVSHRVLEGLDLRRQTPIIWRQPLSYP